MSIEAAYRKVSSPYGFTMYDVEATQALEKASRAAQDLIRAHGFERIMPAMIDYPETFAEGAHRDIFSIKDNSGENLVLRNDITAQVVKGYVRQIERKAERELRKFFYAAPVYKDVRKNYPLPREIYQIGCEVVGHEADSMLTQLVCISKEILTTILSLKTATAVSDVTLHNAFVELCGSDFLDAEARRDAPYLASLFTTQFSIKEETANELARYLFYPSPAKEIPLGSNTLPTAIHTVLKATEANVKAALTLLDKQGVEAYWQPLATPRSNYYTGLYFESFVVGFTEPIVRGGVYNDLVKRYANIEAGACGFALDLLTF